MHPAFHVWLPWTMGPLLLAGCASHGGITSNGFDLSNAFVPLAEIRSGGPPRDGIPSIDRPKFMPAGRVKFLANDDMVVSFTHGGEMRAYPLRILVWHEIVNDP